MESITEKARAARPKRTNLKESADNAAIMPRDRILNAAARQFRERGYKGTTVRDIAEEVGILSGSLFHHFKSKEEILLEIMREAFLSVCIKAEEILVRESDPVQQLRALIRLELNAIVSDTKRNYHIVLYFDWRDIPEAAKLEMNQLRKRHQACWMQAYEGCHALGKLRCEPIFAERIMNGALRGAMTWFKPDGRYSTKEFGDILAHIMLD